MMRRLFIDKDQSGKSIEVLGIYSTNPGVVYATPKDTDHIAHAVWTTKKGNTSNIDYFIINRKSGSYDEVIDLSSKEILPSELDSRYGIQYEIVSRFKNDENLIKRIARFDINKHTRIEPKQTIIGEKEKHYRFKPQIIPPETKTEYVDEILSKAVITIKGLAKIDSEGKQNVHPTCILDLNLDFAQWCISGITEDGKLSPNASCSYCYAVRNHKGYPYIYDVDKNDLINQIKELKNERLKRKTVLRIAKRVEAGIPIFRNQLLNSLEACLETDLHAVMPTKYLEYDQRVAELFKKTNSTLLISLGNDKNESGPFSHGRNQLQRIEDGIKYLEAGVNTVPFLLVDPTREFGGSYYEKSFKRALKCFPRIQLLPIRPNRKDVVEETLGVLESSQLDIFTDNINIKDRTNDFKQAGNNAKIAMTMHPSITALIDNNNGNYRYCHHNDKNAYCGSCFIPDVAGSITETPSRHELLQIRKRKSA